MTFSRAGAAVTVLLSQTAGSWAWVHQRSGNTASGRVANTRAGPEPHVAPPGLLDARAVVAGRTSSLPPPRPSAPRLNRFPRSTRPRRCNDNYDSSRIRNFSIIPHTDHGKSTLADRMLESTETVAARDMEVQLLNNMDIEREKGITIKLQDARVKFATLGMRLCVALLGDGLRSFFCHCIALIIPFW
eukprot:CAMPEP_0113535816 /NCGR_PEP_ID=MMETSP0015_2-20120614/5919_1 /TAXON_ID=2838 /ORGANISM="Odontella" /LENGTH=187 /DNA_ID=CAMNT_0000435119 /DNA_START=148 /DNA_END=709 /DNA_ORIENTATION=+ /assembly_acc=CAM_ASM_000160